DVLNQVFDGNSDGVAGDSFSLDFTVCLPITATVTGGGTICTGSSSTVTVTISGGLPPYTVKLTNNAQSQTGTANQTVFNFTVSPTDDATYQLDAANSHDNINCPLTNSGSAPVAVAKQPTISKSFNPTSIPLNGTSTLKFTITNPSTSVTLTGLAFTDTLPSG